MDLESSGVRGVTSLSSMPSARSRIRWAWLPKSSATSLLCSRTSLTVCTPMEYSLSYVLGPMEFTSLMSRSFISSMKSAGVRISKYPLGFSSSLPVLADTML